MQESLDSETREISNEKYEAEPPNLTVGVEIKDLVKVCWPFKRQSHKIAKPTQTIRRQIADELFECVSPFYGIGA